MRIAKFWDAAQFTDVATEGDYLHARTLQFKLSEVTHGSWIIVDGVNGGTFIDKCRQRYSERARSRSDPSVSRKSAQ